MNDFIRLQQDVIDDDLRTMPAETVNEILADMKPAEAERFLERLRRLRALDIYLAEMG